MNRSNALVASYALVAVVALVATWTHNVAFFNGPGPHGAGDFLRGGYVNHAAASLTNDLLLLALATDVFMIVEGRRVGVRYPWLYVALSMCIASSVLFPLFLIARELRLREAARASK